MQPHASGKRRTMTLRLDEIFSFHFDCALHFVDLTQSFIHSSRVWQCWKDMKTRWSVWRGPLQGTCWQHVAETRASGCGKVCVHTSDVLFHLIHSTKSTNLRIRACLCVYDLFSFVFHSGWRRRVWVCNCCELSHTRCQAYRVASKSGGRSPSAVCTAAAW